MKYNMDISINYSMNTQENSANSDSNNPTGQNKKKYSTISQEIREKFIKRVISKEVTIKEAAKEFGIKFSTSKAILQTFKREGRIGKKKTRQRKFKSNKSEDGNESNNSYSLNGNSKI